MRWVSFRTNEFAFLSINGTAQGVIAIGGVAHGVVAIGGIASAGVVSIGMNAAGTLVAIGMNAVAPISLSLINGLGIFVLAGVNGWGTWARAGTNAAGLSAGGGVNSSESFVPTLLMLVILIVASALVRGTRAKRDRDAVALGPSHELPPGVTRVRARLRALNESSVTLEIRGEPQVFESDVALWPLARQMIGTEVIAEVASDERWVAESTERSYREPVRGEAETVLRCVALETAPPRETWLPRDVSELQWVLGWSARLALAGALAAVVLG